METLQNFLTHYSGTQAYLIFFFLVTVSCLGLFNSDITFITAGALSAFGVFDFRLLIVIGFIALITGDSMTYFAGRKWGRKIIQYKPFSFVLNDEKMNLAESFFKRKGMIIVFMVRFLPFLRNSLFITTGSLQVEPRKFYTLNSISTAIYLPLVIIGSNRASSHANEIINSLKKYQFIPLLIFTSIILYLILKSRIQAKHEK